MQGNLSSLWEMRMKRTKERERESRERQKGSIERSKEGMKHQDA